VEQLESKLKMLDLENRTLSVTKKENEETIESLQNKCETMEETIRIERKKSKKERQKNVRNSTIQETNVKLEPKEEEEILINKESDQA
jgi:hypothetical protein